MLGAIAGDIIGSVFEYRGKKSKAFPLFTPESTFTDDTVMTVAVAEAILSGRPYGVVAREFGRRYPDADYGGSFRRWLMSSSPLPYGSWGNGSAMRSSPIGWAFDDEDQVLQEAEKAAAFSHDHPEGIKGSQAVALAVFLARNGSNMRKIRDVLTQTFGYDLDRTLDGIRPTYQFDVSCQGSVPEAIIAFLESTSWEDAVRNAISLGGDADTQACIAGAIAEAFYGPLPAHIGAEVGARLPSDLASVLARFQAKALR